MRQWGLKTTPIAYRVITPGWTAGSSVSNALGFIKENYTKGEKVVP